MPKTVYTTEDYENIRGKVNEYENEDLESNFKTVNQKYGVGVTKQDGEFVFDSKFDIYFTLLLSQQTFAHPDIYDEMRDDPDFNLTNEQRQKIIEHRKTGENKIAEPPEEL